MRGLRRSLPGGLRAGAPGRCFPGPARPTARPARPGRSLLFSFRLVRAASPAARLSSPPVWLQGQLGEGGVASCPLSNLRRWHQRTGRSFVIEREEAAGNVGPGGARRSGVRGPSSPSPRTPDPRPWTPDPRSRIPVLGPWIPDRGPQPPPRPPVSRCQDSHPRQKKTQPGRKAPSTLRTWAWAVTPGLREERLRTMLGNEVRGRAGAWSLGEEGDRMSLPVR